MLLEDRLSVDGIERSLVLRIRERLQCRFEGHDLVPLDLVHVAVVDGVDRQRHFGNRHRRVLLLLHDFGHAHATLELLAGRVVEIGRKLREGRQFTVLSESQTNTTAQLLDDVGLGRATDARHRDTGVHRRTDARVEQVGFEEDLTVGNRDHVGRHEGRHVTRLGFDDRQARERTGLTLDGTLGDHLDVLFVDARAALEQTGVEIKHVARERFAARRAAQQQRNLAVSDGLLGQIVVND